MPTQPLTFRLKSLYSDTDVSPQFGRYSDGSLAILLIDLETNETESVVTVALEIPPADGCVYLKSWSENEGVPECLEALGLVEPTGRTVPSGFVTVNEYRLAGELAEIARNL